MAKSLFGWDQEYLRCTTIHALERAKDEYKNYLGDGSPLHTDVDVYFLRVKEVASELAKCAGAVSPSLKALSGIVAVGSTVFSTSDGAFDSANLVGTLRPTC